MHLQKYNFDNDARTPVAVSIGLWISPSHFITSHSKNIAYIFKFLELITIGIPLPFTLHNFHRVDYTLL